MIRRAVLLATLATLVFLSLPAQAQTEDPPSAPTGLTGEVAHDQVNLSWADPNDGTITGYQVLRRNKAVDDSGVFHIHVENTGSAATSYTDSDVQAETRYVYRIKAKNAAGLSPRSGYFNADTPAAPPTPEPESRDPPAKPTGLTGEVAHDQVSLSWDDPSDDSIAGYQVLRRNRAVDDPWVFHVHVESTGSAATSYTDSDVAAETRYVYRIKARNAAGLSPRSGYFNADTPAAPPPPEPESQDPPAQSTGLTSAVTHDSVTLSWDDPQDDSITGYRILRLNRAEDDLGEFHIHVSNTGNAATSYVDTDVEPETRYVYRIRALNAAGESPRSGYTNADTPAAPAAPVPAAPTNLFTATTHNQVLLFWQDPDDDSITGYRILRGPDASSLATLVEDTESAATSYTDDSVEPETTYAYALQARNSSGESDRSETVEVTTTAAPAGKESLVVARQVAEISLVSNTGENVSNAVATDNNGFNTDNYATSFHTGDNRDGYTVTSVQLSINREDSAARPEVSIFSDSSVSVGTSLHTLTNPSYLPLHTAGSNAYTLTTFTALADTTYWLVVKSAVPDTAAFYSVRTTASDDEASDDSTEWNIGNVVHRSRDGGAWEQSNSRSILINVQGKLINPPGVVTITPEEAEVGTTLTASLTDEDGGVTNVRWQWSRSRNGETNWTNISGATAASYTPIYIDRGEYLRATASYDVNHGPGKTASGIIKGPPALALVSNDGQKSNAFSTVDQDAPYANQFTTGPNPDGYAPIKIRLNQVAFLNSSPEISIFTNSSGNPDTKLYTLTSVRSLGSNFRVETYTFPLGATLEPNEDYWVVQEQIGDGEYRFILATNGDEDPETLPGWTIADQKKYSSSGSWTGSTGGPFSMIITGKLINPPGVVTFSPEDAQVGTELMASLTDEDGGVTNVRWQWSRSRDGQTGWTNIPGATAASYTPIYADQGEYIRATASYDDDHGTGKTASGIIEGPPGLALVSNTAVAGTSARAIVGNWQSVTYRYATSFHTGDNPDGYALSSVQLLVNRRNSDATPGISIFSDSSGSPGRSLHILTNPSPLPLQDDATTYELTTFTAPEGATLAADTTYWVVVKAVNPSSDVFYHISQTGSDEETSDDSSEWSIGNSHHQNTDGATWAQSDHSISIRMNIQGKLINPSGVITFSHSTPNVDNPLSVTLTDEDGGVTNVRWQWSTSEDGETALDRHFRRKLHQLHACRG